MELEVEGGALDVINPSGSLFEFSQSTQWLFSATKYWDDCDLSIFYNPKSTIATSSGVALLLSRSVRLAFVME